MRPALEKPLWWQPISKLLNLRRLTYALITGGALWVTWLVSISFGPRNMDLANQVIGTDYIQFYASGITLRQGAVDRLYDFDYQSQLELEIAGPELNNFHANLTPPFFAWLFAPLSAFPYILSFAIWSTLSLVGLFVSLHFLGVKNTWHTYLWTLCWFPIFATISFGQNSIIVLLALSTAFILLKRKHTYLSGLVASLALFKPQLIIGISIVWLVGWRKDWRALLGLATGGSILTGLSFSLLPEASRDYVQLVTQFLPKMIYQEQFPLYHLHALRGFWVLLFPGREWFAELLSILLTLTALGFFIRFLKNNREHQPLCYASAIAFTILVTPHAMIYDWVLLLIPAVILWQTYPELVNYWRVIFAILWLGTLVSGPITYLQQRILPVAIQISVPIFILLLIDISSAIKPSFSAGTQRMACSVVDKSSVADKHQGSIIHKD